MFKKILKFLPSIILIATPSLIALYVNLESKIDCNINTYRDHPNCVLASNQEVKEITAKKIEETKEKLEKDQKPELVISNTVSEINHLRQQIYKKNIENLDEDTKEKVLKQSQQHNKLVLELLKDLSDESKTRICQRNQDFIASDSIQLEIKEICDKVLGNTNIPSVEGINSDFKIFLFEVKMEDVVKDIY